MIPAILALSSAWLACSSEPIEATGANEARPPNVLLITIDTLRPDFLGVYGSEAGASPEIDALARGSVVFERAIAASPRTVPSHATIMTSLYVRDHSVGWVNGSSRLDGEWTLAERFADAGYETAAFVGNMMLSTSVGIDAGFDLYDQDLQEAELNRPQFRERTAGATTRRALAWLARRGDTPWLLWVHYQDPHGPYTPPADHAERFDLRTEGEEPLPHLDRNRGEHGIPAYQSLEGLDLASDYASRYAGEIHFLDGWLGRLLEAADAGDAPPIVLLTADHGESFGEDGWWFSHGFRTTPDQIHVPFLLRAPGLAPGRRGELVHHVDVAPTLLSLAGLDVPEDARGLDLADTSSGALRTLGERVVFADVGFEATAYRGDVFLRTITEGDASAAGLHRWASTSRWIPIDGPVAQARPVALAQLVASYLATEVDLVRVSALDRDRQEERLEQLRALGYVEAGEQEEWPPGSAVGKD